MHRYKVDIKLPPFKELNIAKEKVIPESFTINHEFRYYKTLHESKTFVLHLLLRPVCWKMTSTHLENVAVNCGYMKILFVDEMSV